MMNLLNTLKKKLTLEEDIQPIYAPTDLVIKSIEVSQGTTQFKVGDIVYLFMSNTRNVRFKTQVVADNCKREDSEYWLEQAPTDITFRLKLVAEYSGDQLNESVLIKHGFKGGRSLQTPSYKNENLMDYIKSIF